MSHENDLRQLEEELSQIRKEMAEYVRKYRYPYININNEETAMQKNTYGKYVTEVNTETKDLHQRIMVLDTKKYQENGNDHEQQYIKHIQLKDEIYCMYTHTVSADEAVDGCDISVTKINDKYYSVISMNGNVIAMCNYGDLYVPYQQEYYFDNTKLIYEEAMAQYRKKHPND